ncbi:hypothetical protein F5I97DRAFT_45166 [Phlebopus sp. FC_14]|nr:hypothetical protein F5I97DRAFT_45166 [Phlebopus sp. FC_14]
MLITAMNVSMSFSCSTSPSLERTIQLCLSPSDPFTRNIQQDFYSSWKHPGTRRPRVKHIFYLIHQSPHAQSHLSRNRAYMHQRGNEKMLFHGTLRTCQVGDDPSRTSPCNRHDCKLCSILRCSFDPSQSHGMFGHGVYVSPVSSKANIYSKNPNSNLHAMLYANVTLGRTKTLYHAKHGLWQAPDGCDSVTAATKAQGGDVEYPEMVVYREDAICVNSLIIYEA